MQLIVGIIKRFPIIFIVIVVAVGGLLLLRAYLPGSAGDLRVGDCFDEPADMNEVTDVQHRPCTESHDAEVFGVFTHPATRDASYPGDDGFVTYVQQACLPAFASYTGTDYYDHVDLDIGYFIPLASGWSEGDRGIVCYAYSIGGTKLTSSVRAAP